jgi:hypothetical protein
LNYTVLKTGIFAGYIHREVSDFMKNRVTPFEQFLR